jgi:hypothetical protein
LIGTLFVKGKSEMSSKALKYFLVGAAMVTLGVTSVASAEEAAPDGTLTFSGGSVAAGVGYSWGHGTLIFNNHQYPFTVEGLSVVDVGISNIEGAGEVYNLKSATAFAGNYISGSVGATLAGGGSVAALENQNGVVIHFHSTTQGLKLQLAPSGVSIRLKH